MGTFITLTPCKSIIIMMRLRRIRLFEHVALMRRREMCLVEKPDGKRPLGRPRSRWVDDVQMDIREAG
jgi:hypothetical protein